MSSTARLTSDFNTLSPAEQLAQWESFVADLDAGAAGFHRFYPVLMGRWDRGDVPEEIVERQRATFEAEVRADALWELEHPAMSDDWADDFARRNCEIGLAELPF